MTTKTIKVLDPVHCKVDAKTRSIIKHALSYEYETWKPRESGYGKEIVKSHRYLITGRKGTGGHFLTGLLPMVRQYCLDRNIKISVDKSNLERLRPKDQPELEGITFREDQIKSIRSIKRIVRGKIIAPTGSGKTIVAMGAISMFRQSKVVFIVNTKDLFMQTVNEAKKFQNTLPPIFEPEGSENLRVTLKSLKKRKNGLVICLIQSLSKLKPDDYIDIFDVTMIDECHAVNNLDGRYGTFLQNNLSPRRYGFTASDTYPSQFKSLVNEGLLGPVIANLSKEEAVKKKIIAKPEVRLMPVTESAEVKNMSRRSYADTYKFGIVENKIRNGIIVELVDQLIVDDITSLIIIEKIPHGENLKDLFRKRLKIDVPFVYGSSSPQNRMKYKELISGQKIPVVIASRIWMEGINIPSLGAIIYAAGYKEKKKVLQAMGRGLRTFQGKDKIILYDFLDPYRYLAEHTVARIRTYIESRWI